VLEAPALVSGLQDVAVIGEPVGQRQILDGTIRRFSGESGAGSSPLAWTWDDVPPQSRRHGLEDLRVTRRRLAGRWSFSRSHEHGGAASAASFLSESNFSTYCKTTHT